MYEISVITPTFNRALLLPRVWKSLSSQSANFEWIVVDDGSSDNTRDVIAELGDPRITYIALSKNSGVNTARNAGVKLAHGRYVILLDSDDEMQPQSLEHVVNIMDGADRSIGVAAFACVIAETGEQISPLVDGKVLNEHDIVCENALRGGDKIFAYRKEVFDEFLLPEAFRGCEQIFVYEVAKKWKFLTVNRPLSIVHRQCDNLSGAASLIRRSSDIAKSFEILIENHAELLTKSVGTEFEFLKKALYRYGVAGSTRDVMRIYRRIVQRHSVKNIMLATFLLLFSLARPAYFEEWRANRLNRKFNG
jgi:glycosyltransferase involved in cell wall biosynthesis